MAKRRQRRRFGSVTKRKGRGPFYTIRFEWGGRQVQRRVGPDPEDAERRLLAIEALLKTGRTVEEALAAVFGEFFGPKASLKDVGEQFLASRRKADKPSTQVTDARRMDILLRAPWATKPLGQVTPADLMAWRATREKDVSCATVNRDLGLLSRVYVWAQRHEWVPAGYNPARLVEKRKEEEREPCYLSASECLVAIDAACDELRPLLVTALDAGARRSELLSLTWADIDWERKRIRFLGRSTKTGRVRYVPVRDALLEELKALRVGRPRVPRGTSPIFTRRNGKPLTKENVRTRFEALKRRLKKANEESETEAIPNEKLGRLRFHDLRHTCASLLVAQGVPIYEVKERLGHSTVVTTERYAHFAPDAGKAAADAIDRALGTG